MRNIRIDHVQPERDGGFTLIEVVVVILVIGTLIAIALPTLPGARTRSQDRATQSALRAGLAAGLTYFAEASSWTDFDEVQGEKAEPTLDWLDGGDPPGKEISIEIHAGWDLLLIRRSDSGTYYCVAQLAETPSTRLGNGKTLADVDTIAECTGGW